MLGTPALKQTLQAKASGPYPLAVYLVDIDIIHVINYPGHPPSVDIDIIHVINYPGCPPSVFAHCKWWKTGWWWKPGNETVVKHTDLKSCSHVPSRMVKKGELLLTWVRAWWGSGVKALDNLPHLPPGQWGQLTTCKLHGWTTHKTLFTNYVEETNRLFCFTYLYNVQSAIVKNVP